MQNRVSTVSILAIVLWGSTALVATLRAQDGAQGGVQEPALTFTDETLRKTLEGLGYAPRKLGNGYFISIKKDPWTFNIHLALSKDLAYLGLNANLGSVEKLDDVTNAQWMNLLVANGNIDPSFFSFDKPTKKLYIHHALDNRSLTPAYLRQQVDGFCANIKDTADSWKFTVR